MRCMLDVGKNCAGCFHMFSLCTAVETIQPLLPSLLPYRHLLITFMKMFQCCNQVLVLCETESKYGSLSLQGLKSVYDLML